MRLVIRMGPALLALAIACGPRSVSEEPADPTIVVPAPVEEVAVAPAVSAPEPQLRVASQERPRRRVRRARRPRLPAPTGLVVARGYGPPLVAVGPVDWSGPLSTPQPDPAVLVSHLERAASQEAALAELARTHFDLTRALDAVVGVLPTLDRHTRLRAGLKVCYLRRELEALERSQRQLQHDVVAFREMIAPAVRLAERP